MCAHPIRLNVTKEVQGPTVPCGFCIECRSRYARGWAIRCVHEAQMHDQNCFGTLTYDDEHLPKYGSLRKQDFILFMKRLRKMLDGFAPPRKVRYYHVGEYGEINFRPHYHFLIFGYMPVERYSIGSKSAYPLFRSPEIERLWKFGMSAIGEVSAESAQYVAGYVMKKVDKVGRKPRYSVDPLTGDSHEIEPEYSTMSRGGKRGRGLGAYWYDQYGEEVERLESVRFKGVAVMPPRYYDEQLRARDAALFEVMKLRRLRKMFADGKDMSERKRDLMAREIIARERLHMVSRKI